MGENPRSTREEPPRVATIVWRSAAALTVSTALAAWAVWPTPWLVVVVIGTPIGVLALIARAVSIHETRAGHHARAMEGARHDSHLLHTIADTTTDGVFAKDWGGRYLYANQAVARYAGGTPAALIGRTDADLVDADTAESVLRLDRRVMIRGASETHEETRRSEGTSRTFLVTRTPFRDDEQTVRGIVGVTHDITDRQAAERALRHSEERLRHLLELLPDAIVVVDGQRLAYANQAFHALCNVPPDGVRTLADAFSDESVAVVHDQLTAAIERRAPTLPVETAVRRADGGTAPARLVALQIVDQERTQVLLVLQDLTPERRAEALAASVVGHAIDGIISIDPAGLITTFNAAAEDIFGYAVEEVVGRPFTMLMPPHLTAVGHALLAEDGWVEARTRTGFRRESEGLRRDGTAFPIEIAVSAFTIAGQTHIVGVVRDLSEQRRLELELQQSRKLEALGQIAGGVAHDFNNLLTIVSGYADMLVRGLPAGKSRDHAAGVARAAERATALTRQLLTFSRRAVVSPQVVNVNALLEDAGKMLGRVIGEHIALHCAGGPGTPSVVIDPGALEQAIMNLVINARDAMPGGGAIHIRTGVVTRDAGADAAGRPYPAGAYVSIAVSDTGGGIPPHIRPHIFEPFFTTKDAGKGTGLGLAVVVNAVEQAGGHVLLDTSDTGTTFYVELPADGPGEPVVAHRAADLATARAGERVLVVEDEDALRHLLVLTLTNQGYVVADAPDGQAALEWIDANGAVDIVVTDVVMPRLGGRALAEAIARRLPDVPVIFTSGYTDDAMLREHVRVADIDFIPKPYAPATLLAKVREVLDRAHGDGHHV